MGGRPTSVGATLVAGLVALGMACAGDDTNDPQASDTPDAVSDHAGTLSPEAEVEAAYLAYWDMLDRLAQAPDPDDPEIRERASGEALLEVVSALARASEQGHVVRFGPSYGHSIISVNVSAEQAIVRDCLVDDSSIVDQATGEVLRTGELVSEVLEVTLEPEGNHWKVSNVQRTRSQPDEEECQN